MSKKRKCVKQYPNGNIYEGWVINNRRSYLGKLFLNKDKTLYYYGCWNKNTLQRGQYENTLANTTIFLINQNVFCEIKMDICPICMENMSNGKYIYLECNHIYCFTCIKEWLSAHDNCPLCRKYLSTNFRIDIVAKSNLYFI